MADTLHGQLNVHTFRASSLKIGIGISLQTVRVQFDKKNKPFISVYELRQSILGNIVYCNV